MASLRFGPRLLWKKQPILILIVCSIPPHPHHHHHHYHHQTPPHPTPFSLSPCGPRSLWQKQLADLIFKKKKAAAELVKRAL